MNELVKDLAPHNPAIISGLAYGIDISAHKAALEFNLPTVAVVAVPSQPGTQVTGVVVLIVIVT